MPNETARTLRKNGFSPVGGMSVVSERHHMTFGTITENGKHFTFAISEDGRVYSAVSDGEEKGLSENGFERTGRAVNAILVQLAARHLGLELKKTTIDQRR